MLYTVSNCYNYGQNPGTLRSVKEKLLNAVEKKNVLSRSNTTAPSINDQLT